MTNFISRKYSKGSIKSSTATLLSSMRLLSVVACLFLAIGNSFAQSVVVNKYYNNGTSADIVELLVVEDGADLRNLTIKDFSSSNANDGGGKYTFNNITFWSSMRAGTLIILRANSSTTSDITTSCTDFTLDIGLTNTTYFSNTGSFDIAGNDMVMIKSGGTTGVTNNVHTLRSGSAAAQWTGISDGKKLGTTTTTGTAQYAYVNNTNTTLADFDLGTTGVTAAATGLTLGAGNNSTNTNFINFLRGPVSGAATAITGTGFTANWTALTGVTVTYKLDVATDTAFTSLVSGYNNVTVTGTSHAVTGLSSSTTYYYRLRAVTGEPVTSGNSCRQSATTLVGCTTPTAYSVTGTGSYCSGGSGVAVGVANSETGVNYQLYNGASTVGSPVAGSSGSPISFGLQTTAATYTVLATSGSCTAAMTGSATVSIDALPTVAITPAGGASCLTMTASGAATYTWAPATGLSATTGNTVTASPTVTTTYTITGTDGCVGTTTVTVTPASVAISNNSPATANVAQGTANHLLQRYDLAITPANVTLSGLTVTTAGSYTSSDITNLKCWYATSATFDAGTATLLSTFTAPGTAGSKTFPSFVDQIISSGTTGYVYITADIAGSATGGNTINLSATTFSSFSLCAATLTGTDPVAASNVQTITAAPCSGTPTAGTASPSPAVICGSGTSTLTLSGGATGTGLTYQWSSNTTNTPPGTSISGATNETYNTSTVSATTYYWCTTTCTVSTLTNISSVGVVSINPVPSSTGATNNGPICAGGTVTLSANSSDATEWAWSGPDGFTSTLQNPTATPTATGTYSLSVGSTGSGCSPATVYTTSVTVNPTPSSTGATNSGPICVGGTATLTANSSDASAWSWSGPSGYTSSLQNPTVSPTTTGTYSLMVSSTGVSGCSPATVYTTTLTVNPVPTSSGATNNGPICIGNNVTLTANSSNATAWSWAGPSGFTSSLQNPTATPTATGTYSLMVSSTGSACAPSTTYTTSVTVNPVPTVSVTPPGGMSGVSLTASGATTYTWSPSAGLSATTGATVTATPTVTTIYTVSGTSTGCVGTNTVTVNFAGGTVGWNFTNFSSGSNCPAVSSSNVNVPASSCIASIGNSNGSPSPVIGSTSGSSGYSGSSGGNNIGNAVFNGSFNSGSTSYMNFLITPNSGYCLTIGGMSFGERSTGTGPVSYNVTTDVAGFGTVVGSGSWPNTSTWALYTPTITSLTGAPGAAINLRVYGYGGSGATGTTITWRMDDIAVTYSVNPAPSLSNATNGGAICATNTLSLFANTPSNVSGYSWVGPNSFTSTLQNPTISGATTAASGTYTVTVNNGAGCTQQYTTTATVNPIPSSTGATNNGPICVAGTVTLSANSSNANAWSWSGPDGFTSSLQNPTATPSATATFSLTLNNTTTGCSIATVYTTTVSVNPVPSSTGATNNGPICVGGTVTLTANSSDATAWSWSGPSGFTSSLQNPTATPTATGTYSLTLSSTGSGCAPATVYTTTVTVNPVPSSTGATNNGPICVGGTVTLTANSSDATAWSWSGPSGFTSSLQNPTATPTTTGTYSLTLSSTGSGCTPATVYTTTVSVNPVPSSTGATNNGPICVGGTVTLNANSSDATAWSWSGPSGFTSSLQNPTATPTATGTYSLTLSSTGSGCAPATVYTTTVTVNPVPSSTGATNNGPICVGGTVTLTANSSDATAWSWSGPSGFTSSLQNPTATPTTTGTYSLTLSSTGSGCAPATVYTTTVTVNPVPSSTGATNNGPICVGGTVTLTANSSDATAWSWSGPSGFTSSLQNPTATPTATGTYSLTLSSTGSGCAPATVYTTTVTVNPVPSSTGATNNGPICVGGTVTLNANSSDANAWSWSGPSGFTSSLQNPTATPTATGTYSLTLSSTGSGCTPSTVYTTTVTVNPIPSSTGATNNGPICVGGTVTLTANSSNATAWSWSGPSGYTSSLQNPTATPTATGTYSLTLSSTGSGCTPATVYTTTVTVNPVPSSTGATNNGPICVGGTVTLTANSSDATAWSWSGPSGFTSSLQNPTATPTATGTYSLTLSSTGSGCTPATVYTTTVTVNPVPSSTGATNNGPICVGGTVTLTANSSNATAWSWSGPSGFTSSLQNPTATPTATGTYSLTLSSTGSGCAPATVYTTTVTVNPVPSSTGATNNGPICVGGTVTLSANSSDATAWSWSGPSGFTSSLQNPTATPTATGTYSLTLSSTGSGCTPATLYTTTVTVNPVPSSTGATNNGPICVGGTVTLNANSSDATAWSWIGPSGFTSSLQNPTATPTATGTYSLTLSSTGSGCTPATVYTTTVTVNPVPSSTGATNNGPICVGGTVTLTANSSDATAWSWSGPSGFTSSLQNPTATPTATGTYSLTLSSTGSGCTPSTVYTTTVTVNPIPSSTGATNNGPICVGGTVTLTANSSDATAWSWSGPSGFTSSLQNPTATPTATGTYSLTLSSTGSGCAPATVYTTTVTVNPVPSSTGATNNGPICVGGTVTLSANSSDATAWSWSGPSGFTSSLQNPTATPTATGTYSLTLSSTGSGCTPSTVYTTTVTVNPIPSSTGATNNGPICVGGTVTLTANSSNATAWSWSGPSGYTSSLQNPTATPTATGTYSLTLSSTGSGCAPATVYTTTVTANPVPSSTGATNNGPICVGSTVTLTANSSNATAWSWSGPSGFTSSLQNPTATPTSTGTYSLTLSSTGSGCAPATVYTTTVTVNPVPSSTGATNNGPICVGGTVTLTANSSDATAWSWSGPSGFTSSLQNPTATPTATGTYSLTLSSTGSGCTPATVYTTTVTVNPVPSSTGATNNGPICVGGTVTLTANSSNATAWSWSGPSGFTSSLQNPTATPTATGTYSLMVSSTGSGCTPATVYTTTITVNPVPSSTGATNNGPVCVGGTVTLTANSSDATAWSWSGPSGFSSSLQNPTATPTATGTYSLTLSSTGAGCAPSTVYTTTVTVNPIPASTGATNNGPICVSGTVTLSANSSNATAWSWNGPSGFTSSLQNPTATPTATGTYSLTLSSTGSGCAPATVYTTTVTVNPVPSSTGATNNGPICVGGTVTLTANSSNATAWSWSGPSGFTSSLQNPTATPTATGTYSLTLSSTGSGCTPATVYTTTASVNPVPSSTGATNNGPICVGGTVTLSANSSDATAWSWSGPSGFTSSLQNPTATPTATGTYSLTLSSTGSGCTPATVYTTTVTVNPLPSTTGATNNSPICVGATVTLSANSSNATAWLWTGPGSFSSTLQNPSITPTVTGTYSLRLSSTGIGCNPSTVYTTIVTVNAVPSSTGATNNGPICIGSSVTLSANSSNATSWSWSGPDGYTSSLQNPTATPTTTGTFSLSVSRTGIGCSPSTVYTTTVTVNGAPSAITGTTTACVGSTATLSNAGGGTWSSSTTGIATIGSATGIFTGVSSGTSTITYTLPGGCYTTQVVTINASPVVAAITGTLNVCAESSATLSNDTTGGAWSSSATGIATVGSTGIVSAVSAGTARITYSKTNGFGCVTAVTAIFTVNPVPVIVALTGPSSMCVGSSNPFTTSTTSGTWSSSATSIATVGSTGIVTGISSGTVTISYTVVNSFGCTTFATTSLTVNPLSAVASVTGTMDMCVGATTALSSTTTGGVWSSSTPTIASVGTSGIVSGVSSGTSRITYSVTNAFGCTTQGTTIVTVNATPSLSAISGILSLCVGSTSALSNTSTGGVWTSVTTSVATIGTTGDVTGVSSGTSAITYTITNAFGCTNSVSTVVSVNSLAASDTITGNPIICAGATSALFNTTSGGVWSSSNAARATVDISSGIVTGHTAGTVIITYNTGCGAPATQTVTVLAAPASINGTAYLCLGTNTTLTNAASGGTWTSSTPSVATINSSGLVTSVNQGTTTISYLPPSGSCYATRVVTVSSVPSVITGTPFACIGGTSTLLSTPSGGTWSSYFTSKATVNPATGVVTGISAGTTIITYALSAVCRNTIIFTVGALPAAITGTNTVCSGSTVSLSSATLSGIWTSSDTETASIGLTTGIVSGNIPGTATITYTIPTGCTRISTINVSTALSANTGSPLVCVGQNRMTLANPETGGTWSSSNTSVATVHSSSALLSGISSGTANITYRKTPGCYSISIATVNPAMSAITGASSVCAGATVTLAHAETGGTWSSSNISKATADTSTGIITGINAGTTLISYILNAGCYKTQAMTVYSSPGTISGTAIVCTGLSTALSISGSAGGTWSSSNTSVATVGSSGVVTGVSTGTTTISYQIGTGCVSTRVVTVTSAPAAISGTPTVCVGNTTALSSTPTGGTWASSNSSIATVSSSGVVTGINSGTATISYFSAAGCPSTVVVTVSGIPAPISGVLSLCAGNNTLLSSATTGGVWTSDDIAIADVNTATGIVTGVSAGTTTISYSIGCASRSVTVTVNPAISSITGSPIVCVGQTNATLISPVSGGTWSSSSSSIANVHAANGLLTGISAGTSNITFTTTPGCYTIVVATVNPVVANITGTTTICSGATTNLSNATSGGVWSSSNVSKATVNSSGTVTGVSGGTATISYVLSTGCYNTTTLVINSLPNPIAGSPTVVDGASVTLTASPGGGVWSSDDVSIATVGASSGSVTGVDLGATTITYQLTTGCFVTRAVTVVAARPESGSVAGVEREFKLYPNPTSGTLNINAPVDGSFTVYTLDGKLVAQYRVLAISTTVSLPNNIVSGVYMARFNGLDGSTVIVRLVYEP